MRKNKNKTKGTIKKKLCQILFVIWMIIVFAIMINSFETKYFFLSLAGAIGSYFLILFIIVLYCPEVLGSSSNTKRKSSGSSTHLFGDDSE